MQLSKRVPSSEWLARVFLGGDGDAPEHLRRLRDGRHRVNHGPLDRFRAEFGAMELDVDDLLRRYAAARLPVRAIRNEVSRELVPDLAAPPPFDCTFSFTAAGRVVPFIAEMDAALSEWLGVAIECNVYASHDATAYSGLSYHFDEFPVMVLQLSGSKHWSLGGVLPRYPEQGMPVNVLAHPYPAWFSAAFRPGAIAVRTEHEVSLVPGTVLAFPAGMWHSTRADGVSVSLTFGARAPVWTGVLRYVLRGLAMASAPELFAPADALTRGAAHSVPWEALARLRDAFVELRRDPVGLLQVLRTVFGTGTLRWPGPIRREGDRHCESPEAVGALDLPAVRSPARVASVGDAPVLRALFAEDRSAIDRFRDSGPAAVTLATGSPSRFAWAASAAVAAFGAGSSVGVELVAMRSAVARALGPGRGRIEVAPDLRGTDPTLSLWVDDVARALTPWADDVTLRGWRMRGGQPKSAWFVRARDTIAIGTTGAAVLELGGPDLVADDEEPDAGVQFTRRAAFPRTPPRPPTPTDTVSVEPGTVCVLPRGTWMRVEPRAASVAWLTLELHQPSWLGLLEASLLCTAASCSALSRVAFEVCPGALGSPHVEAAPALEHYQRALDRLVDRREDTWALWCDARDYLPGQLVCPWYAVAEGRQPDLGSSAGADAWLAARRGPFALSGFAKAFDPPLVPAAALAALEQLVDAGVLRRVEGDQ